MSTDKKSAISKPMKFVIGGCAGMTATLFVHPTDMVKNRMQLSGEGGQTVLFKNTFDAFRKISKSEGVLALYNGLSAGLFRQATYATVRLGIYTSLLEKFSRKTDIFFGKAMLASVAGACGAFCGTPAEISLIRMCLDGRLPPSQRRNYTNVLNAMRRIVSEEGLTTLWRGCLPTMSRAVVVNIAQLASYSQAKEMFISSKLFSDNILLHFICSMISGFFTTTFSMPFDFAKTRIQNMRVIDGKPEYKNAMVDLGKPGYKTLLPSWRQMDDNDDSFYLIDPILSKKDVVINAVRKEGTLSLWKGWTPCYARIGPHTVLMFIFIEKFTQLYHKYVLNSTNFISAL